MKIIFLTTFDAETKEPLGYSERANFPTLEAAKISLSALYDVVLETRRLVVLATPGAPRMLVSDMPFRLDPNGPDAKFFIDLADNTA